MKVHFCWLLVVVSIFFSSSIQAVEFTAREKQAIESLTFKPEHIQSDKSNEVSGNKKAIRLGKALFFDKSLSRDGEVACASCHIPEKGWSDGKQQAKIRQEAMNMNSPTLWNVAQNRWFFWDGRADSLWSQAIGSMESHKELDTDRVYLLHWLLKNKPVKKDFEQWFGALDSCVIGKELPTSAKPTHSPKELSLNERWLALSDCQKTQANRVISGLAKVIAAYEETILSYNSPFDRYAASLKHKMTDFEPYPEAAKRGLKLFIAPNSCINCHSGSNFSDSEFHNLFSAQRSEQKTGRYYAIDKLKASEFHAGSAYSALTAEDFKKIDFIYKNVAFKQAFKTPTLRNLGGSAPYMHDGRFKQLDEVVAYYASLKGKEQGDTQATHIEETLFQLNTMSQQQQSDLVAFLKTLNDTSFLNSLTKQQRMGNLDE